MKWPSHGSNPHYLYEAASIAQPDTILDFSANINPLGPPSSLKEQWGGFFQSVVQYPDPKSVSLKEKIAHKEGMTESQILIGNGGAEMINLLGRFLTGKHILIIEPAFSEYEKACSVHNCRISFFQLNEGWNLNLEALKKRLPQVDAVFLCNPNNPTGIYYGSNTIAAIAEECRRQQCLFIVDEAFYDFVDGYESLVPLLKEYDSLVLLRSLTKMFAIPGLRLGYAMGSPEIIAKLADYQSHWSVNAVALGAGILCLEEETYIDVTKELIRKEREKLFLFYKNKGFDYSLSQVNFYLLRDPGLTDQYPLFTFLLQKGIVPRHTFNFPGLEGGWLRFAVRGSEENNRLMEAMEEWRMVQPSSL